MKPATSKPGNSEMYIVFTGFTGLVSNDTTIITDLVAWCRDEHKKLPASRKPACSLVSPRLVIPLISTAS